MKCTFYTDPECKPYGNTRFMQLVHDWYFVVNGIEYWIPAGYVFDGASIPRAFWFLIGSPFEPQFWAAALAHDWLYLTHILKREQADAVFRCFLKMKDVGTVRANIMYGAVRTLAGFAWKNSAGDTIELKKAIQVVSKRENKEKFHLAQMRMAA